MYVDRPVLFWTILIAGSVLLALTLWHLGASVRLLWRVMRRQDDGPIQAAPAGRPNLELARRALQAGDYRRSIEQAWAAVTLGPGAWPTTTTPRQLARLVATRLDADGRRALHELLGWHERACYSGQPVDARVAVEAMSAAEVVAGRL
jgi:hypothetical protein